MELDLATTSGAVLTQEEIEQLMGKLESVTTTLQLREKAALKESKVSAAPLLDMGCYNSTVQECGSFPKLPSWLTERLYQSKDFVEDRSVPAARMSLGSLPLALQQQAVVEDLLFLMNGVDGR